MHSFEGEFRRRPQQSLGGASRKLQREELLHKAQAERLEREEKRRVIQSVTSIQAFVRGSLARQHEKQKCRSEFDNFIAKNEQRNLSSSGELQQLVGNLLFFYDDYQDNNRLLFITQIFLKDAASVTYELLTKTDVWLYKFQKLLWLNVKHLKNSVLPVANIALSLRFVEVFTSYSTYEDVIHRHRILDGHYILNILEKLWNFLIKRNYFAILRLVLDNRVPDSLITSAQPPTPLSETLLDLFSRVFFIKSDKEPYYFQMLLQDVFTEELTPQIKCFLIPALKNQSKVLTVDAMLTAIFPQNLTLNIPATPSLLYTFISVISKYASVLSEQQCIEYLNSLQFFLRSLPLKQIDNIDCVSDEDDMMPEISFKSNELHEDIVVMVNEVNHVNMILSLLENEKSFNQCVAPICYLCHALLNQQPLALLNLRMLYTLAFKPVFARMLWRSIISASLPSVFGSSTPFLQIIIQGMSFNCSDQETFLPQLIVFCQFLNDVLSTLHDYEFYSQNNDSNDPSIMPFSLTELAKISTTLKDLCMGLIELAYPETNSPFNRDYVRAFKSFESKTRSQSNTVLNVRLWNQLFKVVVILLRQLYSRDCRRKFCPEGTWVAKQFPIYFDRISEVYFTNHNNHSYEPFIGLRHSSREKLTQEGPPPSAIEARQFAILREFPFAIQFHDRFRIFSSLVNKDKQENQSELLNFQIGPQIRVSIRRNYIYEDAYTSLSYQSEPNMKLRILVQLVNAVGLDEAGIDGGGIFREFLNELLKTSFDPNRGFFKTTHDCLLYPNPNVLRVAPDFVKHYFFIGRMLGKAIYENMLVELPFAGFFLAKILSRQSSNVDIHQLASLDPVMYRNLLYLKTYQGDVSELGLDFTVMNSEFGESEVIELKPDGANIPVTEDNRISYIHLMADFKLNKQINIQCQAFKEGLADVIDMEWLYMFDPNELQILISGAQTPIDIQDLKANTNYANGYSSDHPMIYSFWKVVEGFTELQKHQLLKFVTSCSRAPLLGFKELCPAFCIQNAGRENRLPTASTCMNLLKLPEFDSEETLKMKLTYAVESGAGFELS